MNSLVVWLLCCVSGCICFTRVTVTHRPKHCVNMLYACLNLLPLPTSPSWLSWSTALWKNCPTKTQPSFHAFSTSSFGSLAVCKIRCCKQSKVRGRPENKTCEAYSCVCIAWGSENPHAHHSVIYLISSNLQFFFTAMALETLPCMCVCVFFVSTSNYWVALYRILQMLVQIQFSLRDIWNSIL